MIKQQLQTFKRQFDPILTSFLQLEAKHYTTLDATLGTTMQLITRQVTRGGKRLRPFFTRLGYQLAGGTSFDSLLQAAVSVELIHQYLLMHDDIADRDETRYGQPTLHRHYHQLLKSKYSRSLPHHAQALAMITGDLTHSLALSALYRAKFPAKYKLAAADVITQYLAQTCAGWSKQFFHLLEPLGHVSQADYLKATALVAAHYTVEGPLLVGSTLAGNHNYDQALSTYAYHVGLAFQIQDDILGMFGSTDATGKPVGNDFREGKKTVLIIHAYKHASLAEKRYLSAKIGTPISSQELSQVQNIIKHTQALSYTKKLAQTHARQGIQVLSQLPPSTDPSATDTLRAVAHYLINRDY